MEGLIGMKFDWFVREKGEKFSVLKIYGEEVVDGSIIL